MEGTSSCTTLDSSTRLALLRQLEYYFSDLSFPYDEFLASKKDGAGAIPASVLAGSPRILSMTPQLSEADRANVIVSVVPESDDIRVVDDNKIQRVWPLPDDDPTASRSVYLSGVDKALDEAALRQLLETHSESASFLPVVRIRRLRDVQKDRAHTGQLFLELEDETKAKALLSLASRSKVIVCNKAKLLRDFYQSQHETILEQKRKRAAKAARAAGKSAGSDAAPRAGGEKRAHDDGSDDAPVDEETLRRQAADDLAMLLKVESVGPEATREILTELCSPFGKVAWVDYARGDASGTIRFESAEGAAAALAGLRAAGKEVGGAVAAWREPTAEESKAYWHAYREKRKAQQSNKKQRGGGGRGFSRGRGRGGGHRR